MTDSVGTLKSWRELLATPLTEAPRGTEEEIPNKTASTNQKNPQIPNSLRVDLLTADPTNPQQNPPVLERPRLVRTGPNTWELAEWAKGLCVRDDNLLAAGNVIWCEACVLLAAETVMPWEIER